jgi:hypothetical protein
LSVLVDPAFNLFSLNGGGLNAGFVLFNGAASPSTVSLTVPGSNSQYATIYWNPNSNAAGVVYGAISATPFPILPDDAAFVPLAVVLLTNGQTQVQANNIFDIRGFWNFGPVRYNNATFTGATLNASGASSIAIDVTGGGSQTLTVNNVQVGILIQTILRGSGSTLTLVLNLNTPGGTAYTSRTKTAGAAAGFIAFSANTVPANQAYSCSGITEYVGTTPTWVAPLC